MMAAQGPLLLLPSLLPSLISFGTFTAILKDQCPEGYGEAAVGGWVWACSGFLRARAAAAPMARTPVPHL